MTALPNFTAGTLALTLLASSAWADDKAATLRNGTTNGTTDAAAIAFQRPVPNGGTGHRIMVGKGDSQLPVVVVRGTPYEMGRQLGRLTGDQMRVFVPAAMVGITKELKVSNEVLREVWARPAAFADDRIEQELAGLADGSGLPLPLLQSMHACRC